jgi:hypothetical protein
MKKWLATISDGKLPTNQKIKGQEEEEEEEEEENDDDDDYDDVNI